ncbi:MAG: MFS transporter [Anaerolineae bacterium]|jgi:MFS family permease|nr:MFS transporter [Anaerolineae bacterium]
MGILTVPFVRDRFTWLAYGLLGYFAYLEAVLGPVLPFLRDELGLNYTVGGLHFSALALGMVISGLLAERLVERRGRYGIFWAGGGGMAVGALLVAVGPHPAVTIFGAFIMGLLGTLLLTIIQSSLSDRHGEQRAIALTESNIIASASVALAPLFVGGFEHLGMSWRGALLCAALAWGAMFLGCRDEPVPAAAADPTGTSAGASTRALPSIFWVYWLTLVLGVSVEWSVVSWGANFLVSANDLANADASIVMTLFFVAMVIGRAAGSRSSRRLNIIWLLYAALGIGGAGFMIFWLAPVPALSVIGLFIAGLGIANFFPFLLSIAAGIVPGQSDMASARVALGAGLAILLAPLALGSFADQAGIQAAFGIVFVIFIMAVGAAVFANRFAARQNSRQAFALAEGGE